MFRTELLIGLVVAAVAGAMIAIQTAFTSRAGALIGATVTGMMTAVTSSVFGIIVLIVIWRRGGLNFSWQTSTWWALIIAGVLGAIILSGISFASQRAGVTAALAALLLGQMIVASFVDARALGGNPDPIPFTTARLIGIVLLVAGVYFVSAQN